MRLIRAIVAICVIYWVLGTTFYIAKLENAVKQQQQAIEQLINNFSEAQSEMADIKYQQKFINMVSADMDQRLAQAQGWK